MRASHAEVVARIERGLPGDALHQVVHPADARRVLLHVVHLVERELVLDRLFLLDGRLAELGLLATVSVLRVVEVRNAVVHRDGVADSRLVNKVPGLGFKEGEKIRISRIEFAIVSTASIWYILELRRRANSVFPGAENPHGEGFSKEIIEDLRRYRRPPILSNTVIWHLVTPEI
jgi:hypothetical protein